MLRIIQPQKLKARRGKRPRREIAKLTNFTVTEQDLYSYEKGLHKPSIQKLVPLLQALNCDFEDISEPIEVGK